MAKRTFNSRALRKLAVRLLRELVRDSAVTHADREDLATALVRQWITNEGSAALFIGKREHYLLLDHARPDQCAIVAEPGPIAWLDAVRADWKISPEQLPEIIDRLNRGQSAEIINGDGIPLRFWVNPRERSKGVESLVKQPAPPGHRRDYCKIAAHNLSQHPGIAARDREAFAASVAKQWQMSGGHACLFLGGERQMVLTLTEDADGGCTVSVTVFQASLASLLSSLGFSAHEIPDVIGRINVGQEVEFRDRDGFPSAVWYDPGKRRIAIRTDFPPQQPGSASRGRDHPRGDLS